MKERGDLYGISVSVMPQAARRFEEAMKGDISHEKRVPGISWELSLSDLKP